MPGTGLPSGPAITTVSPTARYWLAGNGEIGQHLQAAGAVGRGIQPFGGGRGADAGGPDDGSGLQPVAAIDDAIGAAFGHRLSQHHFDADSSSERCA